MREIPGVLEVHCEKEGKVRCPRCGRDTECLYDIELSHNTRYRACYNCFRGHAPALARYADALEDLNRKSEERAETAEAEAALARLSAPEHHELLRRERATLNLLSMDNTSSEQLRVPDDIQRLTTGAGYDCVQVKAYGDHHMDEVTRSNLRQAAEALGRQWYGEGWVERMLHWGEVQRYTHLEEPQGMNEWSGPDRFTTFELEEKHREEIREVYRLRDQVIEARELAEERLPTLEEVELLERLLKGARPASLSQEEWAQLQSWWRRASAPPEEPPLPRGLRPRPRRRRNRSP